MEIRLLAGDPGEETADSRVGPDRRCAFTENPELCIGKSPVQGAVADRVDWHRLAAAPAFGNRMVIFDASPERT
jgi:hypothetical protein